MRDGDARVLPGDVAASAEERGALMVVPSDMVGSMSGLAAFAPAAFEPPAPRLADREPDASDA